MAKTEIMEMIIYCWGLGLFFYNLVIIMDLSSSRFSEINYVEKLYYYVILIFSNVSFIYYLVTNALIENEFIIFLRYITYAFLIIIFIHFFISLFFDEIEAFFKSRGKKKKRRRGKKR